MADQAPPRGKAGPACDEFAEFAAELADFIATDGATSEERLRVPAEARRRVTPSGVKRAAHLVLPQLGTPPDALASDDAPTRRFKNIREAASPTKTTPPPSAVLRALDVARPRAIIPREDPEPHSDPLPDSPPCLHLALVPEEEAVGSTPPPAASNADIGVSPSPPLPRISARALLEERPRKSSAWLALMVLAVMVGAAGWVYFTPRGRSVVAPWLAAARSARAAWVASLHRSEPVPGGAAGTPETPAAVVSAAVPVVAVGESQAVPTAKPPVNPAAPPKGARPPVNRIRSRSQAGSSEENPY
jgi:hypothetical protein